MNGTDDTSAPVTRRPRAKRGHGDQLRNEILDAVERLLLGGTEAEELSVRAVADEVGCTAPSLYLHFDDKADLLFEFCARHFARLAERVDAAVAATTTPIAALRASMLAHVRFGLDYPEPYRILFMRKPVISHEQVEDLRTQGIIGFDRLEARCQGVIDTGTVVVDDVHRMALGVWMTVHGIVSLVLARPDFNWGPLDQLVEHTIDTHLRGLQGGRDR